MDNYDEEILTTKEVGAKVKAGQTKVNEYLIHGVTVKTPEGPKVIKLESFKLGKLRRIKGSSLRKFVDELKQAYDDMEKSEQ